MATPSPWSRRAVLALLTSAAAAPVAAVASEPPLLTLYRTPGCGCCSAWAERMRAAGFTRVNVVEPGDLAAVRRARGVPEAVASCHTGVVAGYALEGHVPPADVRRLLAERPAGAVGLAVPGMPIGSPGMESPDGRVEPFETLLVLRDGTTRVWARHGG